MGSRLDVVRLSVAVPSGLAPVVLIGGWSLAAARQPPGYDPRRDTISALAARGATDRWIMTTALALLGLLYLAAAGGLTQTGVPARVLLAVGGLATIVVAAVPQPHAGHVPAATVAFLALAFWPVAVTGNARLIGAMTSVVLLALLVWLGIELHSGPLLGLSERALAGAESLTPLIIGAVLAIVGRGTRA